MMDLTNSRELTGNWYLKKKWFGYKIMVETTQTTECSEDFSISPEFICWEKARGSDLFKLNIKIG